MILLGALAIVVFLGLQTTDAFRRFARYLSENERWNAEDIFGFAVILLVALAVYAWRGWRDAAREERLRAKAELAAEELRAIIPVCSHCHRIRTDAGAWRGLLEYMMDHPAMLFSHGICPECFTRHYREDGSKAPATAPPRP